jgi:hypothetical protein
LAAILAGEVTFSTGIPCAERNHASPRYTRDVRCCACDHQSRSLRAKLAARRTYSRKRSAERQAKVLADIAARDAARDAQMASQREWWKSHRSTAPKPPSPVARKRKIAPHHVVKGIGRV